MAREIVVGTRDSALAMWQTNWVVDNLRKLNPDYTFKIVSMKTQGDKILDVALAKIGDKGLFTKELEFAMLRNEIDLAVHSMKDLPTVLPEGLKIGAICERHDPRDVLVARDGILLKDMPQGARIGTSSLRRTAQLLKYRPDLQIISLRGNLNTRMAKLERENLDGIILAAAGIERLGWAYRITQRIPFEVCLPAVGQGSIGIEIREGDEEVSRIVDKLNHGPSAAAITAERAMLKKLEGGCQIPIGALGRVEGDRLTLEGVVASLDGKELLRSRVEGPASEAASLGVALAEKLLDMGALEILKSVRQEFE
ncbi:hydroxymethylbilane synthase [Thermincola potens]|uniref:Porphobilinogen deaminase n=1 Tax=Thermincola potens (strain JR) TaxID=635013 RepID=D5XEC8_THEPJ|nr:hydroxymethylbilane synthase [Thermincola potens]ADG81999.1 porphobilinogen deaminase [Thermincola potens JR]